MGGRPARAGQPASPSEPPVVRTAPVLRVQRGLWAAPDPKNCRAPQAGLGLSRRVRTGAAPGRGAGRCPSACGPRLFAGGRLVLHHLHQLTRRDGEGWGLDEEIVHAENPDRSCQGGRTPLDVEHVQYHGELPFLGFRDQLNGIPERWLQTQRSSPTANVDIPNNRFLRQVGFPKERVSRGRGGRWGRLAERRHSPVTRVIV